MAGFCMNAQFHAGFTAGLNLSKMSHDGSTEGEVSCLGGQLRVPFNIGIIDEEPMKFSLQPEIVLSMKGTKSVNDSVAFTLNTHYAEIPFMFKAQYGTGVFRPFFNLGPYLGYHIMYYSVYKNGDDTNNSDPETPDKDYMNSMDAGLNLGAGFNASGFLFEIRYGLGFSDVYKDIKSKNRVLSFSMGFLLP